MALLCTPVATVVLMLVPTDLKFLISVYICPECHLHQLKIASPLIAYFSKAELRFAQHSVAALLPGALNPCEYDQWLMCTWLAFQSPGMLFQHTSESR